MKKLLKYDKRIYLMWISSFIIGMEFIGIFMIPFFVDWGGLNQFQIQSLQSWFMFAVFFLEVPTGLIGDVKGRKFSVVLGYLFLTIGPIVYGSFPNIHIFILAEIIFALGKAFESGAKEALMYDICAESNNEEDFGKVMVMDGNFHLAGMLMTGLIANVMINRFDVNQLVQLSSIAFFVGLTVIWVFVKEPQQFKEESLRPNYKEVFKNSFRNLKNNAALRRMALFVSILFWASYFVIWFYQVVMKRVGTGIEQFGTFKIILVISEIILAYLFISSLEKSRNKKVIAMGSAIVIALGYIFVLVFNNYLGPLLFVIFSGGVGLSIRNIFAKYVNVHIGSKERATTLSAISMIRTLFLVIVNPLIGALADYNFSVVIAFIAVVFFFSSRRRHTR